jgi:hypothetical protein
MGVNSAGTTGSGTAGATLTVAGDPLFGSGILIGGQLGSSTLSSTLTLKQESGFTGIALNLQSSMVMELGVSATAVSEISVIGPGKASVTGTQYIDIDIGNDTSLPLGSFPLLSDPAGGLSGNFAFYPYPATPTTEYMSLNGVNYTLTLSNTDTAETLTISMPEPSSVAVMALGGLALLRRRREVRSQVMLA